MSSRVAGWVAALTVLVALGAADPRGIVIEVEAGPQERKATPVVFALPEDLRPVHAFAMERLDDHRPVDVQLLPDDRPSLIWIVRDLPAGASRRYRLTPSERQAGAEAVTCTDDGKSLLLRVGDRPVLRYHHSVVEAPAGLESLYRRSGQIHPLFTPSGRIVTDDFPPDHAHQHGVFFAWVNTTFRGHHVDFWNQKEQTGRVRHAEVLGTSGGAVFGQFKVRLCHEDISDGGRPVAVLDEVWTVRVYNIPDPFLIDFASVQSCAGQEPLVLNQYHYGGMGLRGSRAWFDETVKGNDPPDPAKSGRSDFLTSEGKHRADGNHTRPRWVDLSGQVDGPFGGVAILDHPGNYRAPQPVRLHPNKPYFCFAPMVLGAFEIAPGRPYVSHYRIITHDGPPDAATIDRLWCDEADPPRVRVVEDQ